jgi:polyphosphate kinase 2 (PPK2 family)
MNTNALPDKRLAGYRFASTDRKFNLSAIDPAAKPFSAGDKAKDKAAVEALAIELDALQDLFYADHRYKLLVVLQGVDTSGKDGVLRGVFNRMSPLGVQAVGWKAPTEPERMHDPLWRIHQRVPGGGEIMVFNRSHYEDVLVPVVHGTITPKQTASSANACKRAWTTPPSAGNSTTKTCWCANAGTTTKQPMTLPCRPPAPPGRRGPSCRRTPRRTAT